MAKLRRRDRGAGVRYFIRTADGHELAAGRDLKTARDILAHYRNLEALLRHGVPVPVRSTWTLKRLKEWDLRDRPEPSRARRWAVLLGELGDLLLDDIDTAVLMEYTRRRLYKARPATVNRDISVLASAWKRAKPLSGARNDPFGGLQKLKEERARPAVLPPEAVSRFIATCHELAAGAGKRHAAEWHQNADMIELLYLTASRLSQILELRADQIRGDLLYFPPHKGGLERWFRIEGRLSTLLSSGKIQPFLFPSARAAGARQGFRRFWTKACERAGVTITRHALRASRASAWFAEGKTVADVQRLLGHSSPQMALRLYLQLFPATISTAPPPAPLEQPKTAV